VLSTLEDVAATASRVFGSDAAPREFRLASAATSAPAPDQLSVLAKTIGTTRARLSSLFSAADPVVDIFGCSLAEAASIERMTRARRSLGQMLVGTLAERVFESLYKTTVGTKELRLEDDRGSRTDTDYRVLNGSGRPVFRMNIKFFGTPFRRANEAVGLDPSDCFALATYKIFNALKKQDQERLAYVFAIVGVPEMTGTRVGESLPEHLVHLSSLVFASKMSGKRDIEDQIVRHLVDHDQPAEIRAAIRGFRSRIENAEWRILSARRADELLHEKLFDRVYALRVPGFTRSYGRAEVDMHFSLSQDLTPLVTFFQSLRDHGLHGVSIRLDRGEI